jgi:hypothetical protein
LVPSENETETRERIRRKRERERKKKKSPKVFASHHFQSIKKNSIVDGLFFILTSIPL